MSTPWFRIRFGPTYDFGTAGASRSLAPVVLLICAQFAAGCGSNIRSAKSARVQAREVAIDPATIEGVKLAALPALPEPGGSPPAPPRGAGPTNATYLETAFDAAQTTWREQFKAAGLDYGTARLVFFSDGARIPSPCRIQAQAGPFYCGADHVVYLDRRFLALLASHAGSNGFAGAYLVSQLLGRHVQRLAGIDQRVGVANRWDPAGRHARVEKVELQADCLSGVWAHSAYTNPQLPTKDIDDALRSVSAAGHEFETEVGDVPLDTGLWSQRWQLRVHWFDRGFASGDPATCRTFSVTS